MISDSFVMLCLSKFYFNFSKAYNYACKPDISSIIYWYWSRGIVIDRVFKGDYMES